MSLTDDEWEKQRSRAILAAFQTGRPVFADTDGELRYVDDDRKALSDDVGIPRRPVPRVAVLIAKASRASYWAMVSSAVAAILNTVLGIWRESLWYLGAGIVTAISTALWYRVRRSQLAQRAAYDGANHE